MRVFLALFFLALFPPLRSDLFAGPSDFYYLRVVVLDAKDNSLENQVYQLPIAEILTQDIRKIPGIIAIDRDTIKEKITDEEMEMKLEVISKLAAVRLGADLVLQVEYTLLDEKQMECALNMVSTTSGRKETLKNMTGREKDILKMLDLFTLSLAQRLDRSLSKKQKAWIQRKDRVSLKSLTRYGKGLELYYEKNVNGMVLAREQFRKAEKQDVLFLLPYVARAKAELFLLNKKPKQRKKLLADAHESLRKAIFINSKFLEGYELLSQVYYLKGDYVGCVREGLRAIRLNPLSIQARLFVAKGYDAMNKMAEAKRELKKILELDPTHLEARELLGHFQSRTDSPSKN